MNTDKSCSTSSLSERRVPRGQDERTEQYQERERGDRAAILHATNQIRGGGQLKLLGAYRLDSLAMTGCLFIYNPPLFPFLDALLMICISVFEILSGVDFGGQEGREAKRPRGRQRIGEQSLVIIFIILSYVRTQVYIRVQYF